MNLSLKNKNPFQATNYQPKLQVENKQTKKKACIIKLQVNKLLKTDVAKNISHKTTKSQQFDSHTLSQVVNQHGKSLKNQNVAQNQKKVIKSFEQLYFQKIKERKLQQTALIRLSNVEEQRILVQRNRPNSCKNIFSLKNLNQPFFPSPQSTKNQQLEDNKQNYLNNIKNGNDNHLKTDKFFKKKNIKTSQSKNIDNLHFTKSIQKLAKVDTNKKQNYPSDQKNLSQQQKSKKILKIKRSSKFQTKQDIQISNLNQIRPSLLKPEPNDFQIGPIRSFNKIQQKAKIQQNSLLQQLNLCQSSSAQLKTFKLLTPSSSGQKLCPISFTQSLFDQIVKQKINHSFHQHIWDDIQCFFSHDEFLFVLQQLGFKDTLHSKQISFYLQKLWQHLGGDLYGGVVKQNMRQFLNLVLEDDYDLNSQIAQAFTSKSELSHEQNFIDKASLKLIKLDQKKKDQIRKFYFPFRITKIASQIHQYHLKINSGQKLHNSINGDQSLSSKGKNKLSNEKESLTRSDILETKQICLQNNAYLDTISVKNRDQDVSPCMIPTTYDSSNDINFVTDFSPKMAAQKYESFKSTVLSRDDIDEKLSTQQQEDLEIIKNSKNKPLLSVDVNLGEGILQKLLVYEGEDPYQISLKLKERYNIDDQLRQKFQKMLRNHLNTLLFKIDQVSEELFEDSVELNNEASFRDFVLMEKN